MGILLNHIDWLCLERLAQVSSGAICDGCPRPWAIQCYSRLTKWGYNHSNYILSQFLCQFLPASRCFKPPFLPFPFRSGLVTKLQSCQRTLLPFRLWRSCARGKAREVRAWDVGLATNHCAPCFSPNAPGKAAVRIESVFRKKKSGIGGLRKPHSSLILGCREM